MTPLSAVVSRRRGHLRGANRIRCGLTLIELLAVITIIGILTSIVMGALYQADQTSKIAKTRSLVQKISNMLMARYDNYRTMRMPIPAEGRVRGGDTRYGDRQKIALRRMLALREMMRMEIPDRYSDITTFTPVILVQYSSATTTTGNATVPVRPYLWSAYRRKIADNGAKRKPPITDFSDYVAMCQTEYSSAEMLYLIMTTGVDDSSVGTEHFVVGDSGDKDNDGMREFHDAWDNPIEFLRWAPGFVSTMQPMFYYPSDELPYNQFHNSQPQDDSGNRMSRWQVKVETIADPDNPSTTVPRIVIVEQTDALNPMRIGTKFDSTSNRYRPWEPGDPPPEYGYYLAPLVYSIGPDFRSGLQHLIEAPISYSPSTGVWPGSDVTGSDPYNTYQNTYSGNQAYYPTASRGESTREGFDLDNIHNQDTVTQ